VDVLVAGQGAKLVDACLDVVVRHFLALADRIQVDLVAHGLVGGDGRLRHVQPQVALALEHGDPEVALEQHAPGGRPDGPHVRGGVPAGQDVDNDVVGSVGLVHCAHATGAAAAFPVQRKPRRRKGAE